MNAPNNGERRPRHESGVPTPAKKSQASLPTEARPVLVLAAAEVDATAAPCRRCGHPLTAPRSVARGIGPVCVHLVRGEA